MAEDGNVPTVTALRRWLYIAALLRFGSVALISAVYLGFFDHTKFHSKLFSKRPDLATELFGRTFAIWTLTTCILCLICARDPTVPAIYGATLFSFIVAMINFLLELLVFETMTLGSATTPILISGISVLWMGMGWSYYTNYARRPLNMSRNDSKSE